MKDVVKSLEADYKTNLERRSILINAKMIKVVVELLPYLKLGTGRITGSSSGWVSSRLRLRENSCNYLNLSTNFKTHNLAGKTRSVLTSEKKKGDKGD